MVNIDPAYNPYPIEWANKDNRVPTIEAKNLIEQIEGLGVMARWESAARCACSASDTMLGTANENCSFCNGSGWVYHHPQETMVLVQGFNADRMVINQPFMWESGDVMITMRAEHCPSYYDRIVLLDSRMTINARLVRRAPRATEAIDTAYEPLNVPIAEKQISYKDTNGNPVIQILDVLYLQGQDAATKVAGPVLVAGEDFTVDYDHDGRGRLNWAIGDLKNDGHGHSTSVTPEVGSVFTISYITRPVYIVKSWTHTVRDTTTRVKSPGGTHLPMPVQFKASLDVDLRDVFQNET